MMTMAVLMNHSGRSAVRIHCATAGRKFPITRPTSKAMINPASDVKFSDQGMPNVLSLSGVAAMYA